MVVVAKWKMISFQSQTSDNETERRITKIHKKKVFEDAEVGILTRTCVSTIGIAVTFRGRRIRSWHWVLVAATFQ
jgi:hypothetical protein